MLGHKKARLEAEHALKLSEDALRRANENSEKLGRESESRRRELAQARVELEGCRQLLKGSDEERARCAELDQKLDQSERLRQKLGQELAECRQAAADQLLTSATVALALDHGDKLAGHLERGGMTRRAQQAVNAFRKFKREFDQRQQA